MSFIISEFGSSFSKIVLFNFSSVSFSAEHSRVSPGRLALPQQNSYDFLRGRKENTALARPHSQAGLCLFFTVFNIVHDVTDIALQQAAEVVYGMGIDVLAAFNGIVVGTGESHFHQAIGRDALGLHRCKQRLIAYHPVTSQTRS